MAVEKVLLNEVEFDVEKDGDKAIVSVKDEDIYFKEADKAGLTKKVLKDVDKFQHNYLKSVVDTSVEEASKIFKDDSNIEVVEVTMPNGVHKVDKATTIVHRANETRIPGTDKTIIKPLIKVKVTTNASKVSKAHIRELRDELDIILAGK